VRRHFTWGRRTAISLLAVGVAAGSITLTGVTAAQAAPAPDPVDVPKTAPADTPAAVLGAHDAELLTKAEVEGDTKVTVIIAADQGDTAAVVENVRKLGGTVTRRNDQVGYVSAVVPTAGVLKTAKLDSVTALDLDEVIQLPKPEHAGTGGYRPYPAKGPGPRTRAENPFLPAHEMGAVDFKRRNPQWDGRGITVGIMDSGVDLDHPALQRTTTGERKIVDWFTATSPVSETEPDGTWLPMVTEVAGPSFKVGDVTYRAPAGTWKVATFRENITAGSEPEGDVNRDGDTTDVFGVLYDPASHDIRVDANQNQDFTDDAAMRPYKEKFQVGHFGTDKPGTAVREQMPFVVEFREDVDASKIGLPAATDYVNIGIVEGMHGSHVAGITAANDLLGNRDFDGVAPGAKIVSARACSWGGGCTADALVAGMEELVAKRGVDVVNMSIGGLPAFNDDADARSTLYDRLIDKYNVQLFIAAGNSGPGDNTIGTPSLVSKVVSVAASISRETWQSNYGSTVRTPNALFNFSSRGPREDGGFKPNITAPGSAISAAPLWQPGDVPAEAGYQLPPGYAMANGTSMSSPQAAGAAALLLSAAKAGRQPVPTAALRRALYTSADPIRNVPVAGQGYGMVDVPGAWKLLAKGAPETRTYTSEAPVCTELSPALKPANVGVGIYNRCAAERGGHVAGQRKSYTVKLTRTSGPAQAVRHDLRWVGNDGTFSAPRSVSLPLNQTVEITVDARAGVGKHSALLTVDDPATPVIDFEVLATVIVGVSPAAPSYETVLRGAVDRNATQSIFINVPAGVPTLQVKLSGLAKGSETRFIAIQPVGVPLDSTSSLVCYPSSVDKSCKADERDYRNPAPGLWEIEVEARRTSGTLVNPFTLTARFEGVAVTPAVVNLPEVQAGVPTPVSWTVQNRFAPVTVTGQGGPLGSRLASRPTIENKKFLEFPVVVPAGATRLDVAIGNTADLNADLDLYLLKDGVQVARDADADSEESISLADPAAGAYVARVEGFKVETGTTLFDYSDTFFDPGLGSVDANPATLNLGPGGSGTLTGAVTVKKAGPAGRSFFGEMNVVTSLGATVGTAAVAIGTLK
jgi:subtilisin family serine protease